MISFCRPSVDGALDFNLGPAQAGGVLSVFRMQCEDSVENGPTSLYKRSGPCAVEVSLAIVSGAAWMIFRGCFEKHKDPIVTETFTP